MRVIYRSERRDIFTGLYCFKDDWDSESGKLFKADKITSTINQNLELISRKAHDAFDTLKFSGSPFTIDELVNRLKGKETKPTLLIDFLEEGNEQIRKKSE